MHYIYKGYWFVVKFIRSLSHGHINILSWNTVPSAAPSIFWKKRKLFLNWKITKSQHINPILLWAVHYELYFSIPMSDKEKCMHIILFNCSKHLYMYNDVLAWDVIKYLTNMSFIIQYWLQIITHNKALFQS